MDINVTPIFAPYTANCKVTWNKTTENQEIYHAFVGIISELPELSAAIDKKDYINRLEETGDILYYSSILMDLLGITDLVETLILSWTTSFGADKNIYSNLSGTKTLNYLLLDFADVIKKTVEYKKPINKQEIVSVMAQLYASLYLYEIKDSPSGHKDIRSFLVQCMNMNYLKLWLRYGTKFSEEAANNRDVKAEYNALKMSVRQDWVYTAEEMETFYISKQPEAQQKFDSNAILCKNPYFSPAVLDNPESAIKPTIDKGA
jgi:hypothetical protein